MLRLLLFLGLTLSVVIAAESAIAHIDNLKYTDYTAPEDAEGKNFILHKAFKAEPFTVGDVNRFMFDRWTGPDIPVGPMCQSAPILIIMHGAK